jgi:ketosteroid isomerase-like protein
MPHPNEETVRRAYAAINARNVEGFIAEFADDAVWHGSGTEVRGKGAIGGIVSGLIEASGGTLHIELHDVLANDEHVAVLQITRAERKGHRLADRVIYVFHLDSGKITQAWFNGDPRVQDEFWSD